MGMFVKLGPPLVESGSSSIYYKNCDAVRRWFSPLYRGESGYACHLDRDNDGVACE